MLCWELGCGAKRTRGLGGMKRKAPRAGQHSRRTFPACCTDQRVGPICTHWYQDTHIATPEAEYVLGAAGACSRAAQDLERFECCGVMEPAVNAWLREQQQPLRSLQRPHKGQCLSIRCALLRGLRRGGALSNDA